VRLKIQRLSSAVSMGDRDAIAAATTPGRWKCQQLYISPAVDADIAVTGNQTLAPFTAGDYRASVYWFRHVDMAVLLALSLILVFWAQPTSSAAVIGKAMATIACASTSLVLLWYVRPYPSGATWKLHVRSLALALTMLATITNCLTGLADLQANPDASWQKPITAFAVLMTIGCASLLVTLVVAFGKDMIVGAKREQAHIEEVKAAQRVEVPLPEAAFDPTGASALSSSASPPAECETKAVDADNTRLLANRSDSATVASRSRVVLDLSAPEPGLSHPSIASSVRRHRPSQVCTVYGSKRRCVHSIFEQLCRVRMPQPRNEVQEALASTTTRWGRDLALRIRQ
jgi:hypothetical protein